MYLLFWIAKQDDDTNMIPTLETERLYLKPLELKFADDIFEYASLDTVSKYAVWPTHKSIEDSQSFITFCMARYGSGRFYDWALVLKNNKNKVIGTCGLPNIIPDTKEGEIGFIVSPEFANQGYTAEAASGVIDFAFNKLDLARVIAKVATENLPSSKLAEKLGMKKNKVIKNGLRNHTGIYDLNLFVLERPIEFNF
ncbi:MAG: GNAT family N-acetyltransferase [Leptospirales bacterium]